MASAKKKTAKKASRAPARNKVAAKKTSAPNKKTANRVVAVKKAAKSTKKVAAKKPTPIATKKAVVKKTTAKNVAPRPAAHADKPASPPPKKTVSTQPDKTAQAPKTNSSPRTSSPENLSAEEKKKRATQHMWELVQAKKQRAAQPPSWQAIEHHDHPAPQGGQGGVTDQNTSASVPTEMPGHRERGGS